MEWTVLPGCSCTGADDSVSSSAAGMVAAVRAANVWDRRTAGDALLGWLRLGINRWVTVSPAMRFLFLPNDELWRTHGRGINAESTPRHSLGTNAYGLVLLTHYIVAG